MIFKISNSYPAFGMAAHNGSRHADLLVMQNKHFISATVTRCGLYYYGNQIPHVRHCRKDIAADLKNGVSWIFRVLRIFP